MDYAEYKKLTAPGRGAEISCRLGRSFWLDGFPLRVIRCDHRRNRSMHKHDFFELVVVISGSCMHVTPAGSYKIATGDVFLIRPGTVHSYEAVVDFSLVNLLYAPELFPLCDLETSPGYQTLFVLELEHAQPEGAYRHLKLDRETLDRVENEISRLESALAELKPGHQFRALGIFLGIVSLLTDYFTEVSVPEECSELFRLGRLLGFLEQNYMRALTLPKMAKLAAVSEVTLYRLFQKGTGESPINYLNRVRLRHAQAFLLNTRRSITEIAAATGFADSNYFSRCFRKFAGMSPREFRRNGGTTDKERK